MRYVPPAFLGASALRKLPNPQGARTPVPRVAPTSPPFDVMIFSTAMQGGVVHVGSTLEKEDGRPAEGGYEAAHVGVRALAAHTRGARTAAASSDRDCMSLGR